MNTLIEKIKQSANRTTMKQYQSKPIPDYFIKRRWIFTGKPQPSIMQQAFIDCVLRGR